MQLPNQYREARSSDRLQPEDDPDAYSGLADAYRLGWMGQIADAAESNRARPSNFDPGFDALNHIPEGYEEYAGAFLRAQSVEQVAVIRRQIDENLAIRARREARGGWSTFLSDLGAGILDPVNLVAPELRGLGVLGGTVRGASIIGGPAAATELVRGSIDPTSPIEETVAGVSFSFLLGGAIGGTIGGVTSRAVPATPPAAGEARTAQEALLPAQGRVTSGFGPRRAPRTPQGPGSTNHPGIDIDGNVGDPVVAPLDGTVVATGGPRGARGNWVEIDHGNGLRTRYFHLDGFSVRRGQRVRRGERIAAIGNTGRSTGAHLHYEAELDGRRIDPRRLGTFEPDPPEGRMASSAGVDPIAATSFLERIEMPRSIELDGRGVPVRIGPTGRYDENGNYIPAAYSPAREPEPDPLAISIGPAELPGRADVERASPVQAFADDPTILPAEAAPEPAAAARVAALGIGDDAFFGGLKDIDIYRAAAERGLENLSVRERRRLASALADELDGDPARQRALFGGDPPRRLSAAAVRRRLDDIVKERVRLRVEGRVPPARIRDEAMVERDEGRPDSAWVLGPDGEERFVAPEAPRFVAPDEAIAEMRALERRSETARRMREIADDTRSAKLARVLRGRADQVERGEITPDDAWEGIKGRPADEVPFTADRTDADDLADEFGEHFRIDVGAILGSFDARPWTRPRIAGVAPLPVDAFRSPHEWLNFVFIHEREHVTNKRLEGEELAAYEDRINARALAEVRAGRLPMSPEDSRLQRLALAPTPIGQLMRLVPAEAQILRDVQDLAGDMATQLIANRGGAAIQAGGSVFQRTLRWIATTAELRLAIRRHYLEYVQGSAPKSGKATEAESIVARLPVIGTAARRGKVPLREFREAIVRAQVGAPFDVVDEALESKARSAARVLNDIFERFEKEARELGVFERSRDLARVKQRLQSRADALEARLEASESLPERVRADLGGLIARLRAEADAVELDLSRPVRPANETRYLPRIWDVGALRADKEKAIDLLRSAYIRAGSTPDKAELQAKGAYDAMIGEGAGDFMPVRPSAAKGREVPLTNAEAWDFIVKDPELILGIYSRRMGAAIEMTRRFGDPAALDHEDDLLADLLLRGVEPARAQKAMQIWRDARDRVAGGFHGKDPMSWDNRTARALKNFASLAVMGRVLYSQVVDVARAIGTVGPRPLWKSLAATLSGDLGRFEVGPYAKQAGEALELVLARTTARIIEADDALLVTRETMLERGLAVAQAPFFVANLMIPFTVIMKEWTSLAAGHVLIDEAQAVARALQAGAEPDGAMVARLAAAGIDRQDAQLLASMPIERTDGGLNLANVNAWEGAKGQRARDLFLGAVNGEVRRSIITPGPLDKPAIMDGVLHTAKGREAGIARVEAAQDGVDAAWSQLRRLRQANAPEDAIETAVEAVVAARGELTQARRALGRAGRLEAPLLSLPLQLKSFVLASGGKLLHGLLSSRDRAKAAGLVSLMIGGVFATWLKNGESGRWQHMDWPEIAFEAFNNSGIGAWFADVAQAVDNGLDLIGDDVPGAQDEVGSFAGVAPGLVYGLFEAFVSDDLSATQRTGVIRRTVPLNNLLWWDQTVRRLSLAMTADDETPALAPEGRHVPRETPIDALLGFTSQDLRARPDLAVPGESLDPAELELEQLVAAYERDPRTRRRRRPRPAAATNPALYAR